MRYFLFCVIAVVALSSGAAAQWSQLPGKSTHWCLAVYATGNAILAATQDSNIIRSTDQGETWVPSSEGIDDSIYTFTMYGEERNVYLGSNKGVYSSTDGGLTWGKINAGTPTPTSVYAFYRFGDRLFMGSDSGVFRSLDNGKHWEAVNAGFPGLLTIRSFAAGDNYLYAGTKGYGLYRSSDYGEHWEKMESNLPGEIVTIRALWVNGPYMLVMNGLSPHYRSTDGGKTWTSRERFSVSAAGGLWIQTVGGVALLGTEAGVMASADNGATWYGVSEGMDPGAVVYSMSVVDGIIYAGSTTKWIWRRPLSEILPPAGVGEPVAPYALRLNQSTPNPTAFATEISYSLPNYAPVSLKLYNAMMQEVSTLVDGPQEAGEHHAALDVSGLPSGTYYYRLSTGTSSLTRCMVVVK